MGRDITIVLSTRLSTASDYSNMISNLLLESSTAFYAPLHVRLEEKCPIPCNIVSVPSMLASLAGKRRPDVSTLLPEEVIEPKGRYTTIRSFSSSPDYDNTLGLWEQAVCAAAARLEKTPHQWSELYFQTLGVCSIAIDDSLTPVFVFREHDPSSEHWLPVLSVTCQWFGDKLSIFNMYLNTSALAWHPEVWEWDAAEERFLSRPDVRVPKENVNRLISYCKQLCVSSGCVEWQASVEGEGMGNLILPAVVEAASEGAWHMRV